MINEFIKTETSYGNSSILMKDVTVYFVLYHLDRAKGAAPNFHFIFRDPICFYYILQLRVFFYQLHYSLFKIIPSFFLAEI